MGLTLADYQRRKNQMIQQEREKQQFSPRCLDCGKVCSQCFCSFIHPFWTPIRFVLLMHPMEFKRERVGTGRLSHRCLLNSEIRVGVDFTQDEKVNSLINDPQNKPFILYPGPHALNLSLMSSSQIHSLLYDDPQDSKQDLRPILFLLDGTWPCAKKMMKLSPNLQKIPRLSLNVDSKSRFIIKQQPDQMCLSTIETIYHVLQLVDQEQSFAKAHILLDVLDRLVQTQIKCALDPHRSSYRKGSFKPLEQRKKSLKWEKRHLFFQG